MYITPTQYALFKEKCREYQRLYSLMDWELYFDFKKLDDSYAQITWDSDSKKAVITITSELDENDPAIPCFDDHIVKSAHHEILHLLLAELQDMALDRYLTEYQFSAGIHRVIHIITGIVDERLLQFRDLPKYGMYCKKQD